MKTKYFVIITLLLPLPCSSKPRLRFDRFKIQLYSYIWVHNNTHYPIALGAICTQGKTITPVIQPHTSNWHSCTDFKPDTFTVIVTLPDKSTKSFPINIYPPKDDSLMKKENEEINSIALWNGGSGWNNRKIIIKDRGTPETIYVDSNRWEKRPVEKWHHIAEDTNEEVIP